MDPNASKYMNNHALTSICKRIAFLLVSGSRLNGR